MISEYKLQVIRQIKENIDINYETNECSIKSIYLNNTLGFEPDSLLHFSSYSKAMEFIIESVIKE